MTRSNKDEALSLREQAFIEAYGGSASGNGAAAVREAGYKTKNEDVHSARLLAKARIREAIERRREQLRREADVTAQEVIATLAAQMRGDITEMMDASGQFDLRVVRRKKMGGLIRRIEFASLKETRTVKGKRVSTTRQVVRRIELVSQQQAAIKLCKMLGLEQKPGENLNDPASLREVLNERIELVIEGFRRGGVTVTRRDVLEMYKGYSPETSRELMPLIEKELAQTGLNSQMARTTKGKALSLREEAFVEAHVVSAKGNGAAAVREAGYKTKNADVYAAKLLAKASIRGAIERRRDQLRREASVTGHEVITTLTAQMRGDITELTDASGQFDVGVVRSKKLGGLIKVIEFASLEETQRVDGRRLSTTRQIVRRIELVSQQQAAIQLCKVLGIEREATENPNDPAALRKLLGERVAFAIEGFRRGGVTLTRREMLEMYRDNPAGDGEMRPLIQEELTRITQEELASESEASN